MGAFYAGFFSERSANGFFRFRARGAPEVARILAFSHFFIYPARAQKAPTEKTTESCSGRKTSTRRPNQPSGGTFPTKRGSEEAGNERNSTYLGHPRQETHQTARDKVRLFVFFRAKMTTFFVPQFPPVSNVGSGRLRAANDGTLPVLRFFARNLP